MLENIGCGSSSKVYPVYKRVIYALKTLEIEEKNIEEKTIEEFRPFINEYFISLYNLLVSELFH